MTPNTTQSLFPCRVALTPTERGSRELIRRIEGRPGPHLRSVQHQHQPLRDKQTESHPRGEQHRVRFIQSGASDGARCTASLSSPTPGLCKLTLEGTNSLVVEGLVSAALKGSYRTRAWIIVLVSPFPWISCWTVKHAHRGFQRNKANRCCLKCVNSVSLSRGRSNESVNNTGWLCFWDTDPWKITLTCLSVPDLELPLFLH